MAKGCRCEAPRCDCVACGRDAEQFLGLETRLAACQPETLAQPSGSFFREVLHGVVADGVGVKFPIFAVNCCSLPLSFRRRGKMRRKRGKCVKKGKNA